MKIFISARNSVNPKVHFKVILNTCSVSTNNFAFVVSKLIQAPKTQEAQDKCYSKSQFVHDLCFLIFADVVLQFSGSSDLHLENLRSVPIISDCPIVHCSGS